MKSQESLLDKIADVFDTIFDYFVTSFAVTSGVLASAWMFWKFWN